VFNPSFMQITLLNSGLQIIQGVIQQCPNWQHTVVSKGLDRSCLDPGPHNPDAPRP
jgi:hypothetical protein